MKGLPEWFVVGAKFRVVDRLYHVRGFVDDRAVVRTWLKHKRRWEYEIKDEIWCLVWKADVEVVR